MLEFRPSKLDPNVLRISYNNEVIVVLVFKSYFYYTYSHFVNYENTELMEILFYDA